MAKWIISLAVNRLTCPLMDVSLNPAIAVGNVWHRLMAFPDMALRLFQRVMQIEIFQAY